MLPCHLLLLLPWNLCSLFLWENRFCLALCTCGLIEASPNLRKKMAIWSRSKLITIFRDRKCVSHSVVSDSLETPWTVCSPPSSSVHGIPQARRLEWVAISSSRGSSQPRHQTPVSRIVGRFFIFWATREAHSEWKSGAVLLEFWGRTLSCGVKWAMHELGVADCISPRLGIASLKKAQHVGRPSPETGRQWFLTNVSEVLKSSTPGLPVKLFFFSFTCLFCFCHTNK